MIGDTSLARAHTLSQRATYPVNAALAGAVLKQACIDVGSEHDDVRDDARAWFADLATDTVFSLVGCCKTLSLSLGYRVDPVQISNSMQGGGALRERPRLANWDALRIVDATGQRRRDREGERRRRKLRKAARAAEQAA
jgi:hypothetical protein